MDHLWIATNCLKQALIWDSIFTTLIYMCIITQTSKDPNFWISRVLTNSESQFFWIILYRELRDHPSLYLYSLSLCNLEIYMWMTAFVSWCRNVASDISIAYIDDVTSCFREAFREQPGRPSTSFQSTFFKSKKVIKIFFFHFNQNMNWKFISLS